jgi:hypothetical protein
MREGERRIRGGKKHLRGDTFGLWGESIIFHVGDCIGHFYFCLHMVSEP